MTTMVSSAPGFSLIALFVVLLWIVRIILPIALMVLTIRALMKYIRSKPIREEQSAVKRSLGETIRAHRTRCQMTQEFVAESLGVTRQAVSKWEQGASDPSTSNLLALAKLFGVSAAELLGEVE